MELLWSSLLALLCLVASARCAPAAQDACVSVRSSSLALNKLLQTMVREAKRHRNMDNFAATTLRWMEAGDMCDPAHLRTRTGPCVEKLQDVLHHYVSAVDLISGFASCSGSAPRLRPALHRLQQDVRGCLRSRGQEGHRQERPLEERSVVPGQLEAMLCDYTINRLFSFSILAARVFAVGDPAQHVEGSAHRCQ